MTASSARVCPKCKGETRLKPREAVASEQDAEVDIDVCPGCGGVWLDWGELSKISEMKAIIDGASSGAAWKKDLQRGRCPSCEDRPVLGRISIGAFGIERCPTCLGLWFDRGELGPTLSAAQLEKVPRSLRKLLKIDHRGAR